MFSINCGSIAGKAKYRASAEHMTHCPAHIFCGQEVDNQLAATFALAGWSCSDEAYLGQTRTENTPQLFIAAWPSVCSELRTLQLHSRTFKGRPGAAVGRNAMACHWMTAHVRFRWMMGRQDSLTITTMHLHRDLATLGDNSQAWRDCAHSLALDLRSGGVRMLTGDANMSLFRIASWLEEQEGIQMELIARACGLNINEPVAALSDRGLREAMLHDSCGIWILGPRGPARPLTLDSRCVVAACHPALFEDVPSGSGRGAGSSRARAPSVTGKVLTRGYACSSYKATDLEEHAARKLPSQDCVTAVLRIWQAHERVPLDRELGGGSVWRLNFLNLLVPPEPGAQDPRRLPLALAGQALPPPPAGPPPADRAHASAHAARHDLVPDRDAAARALAPAGLLQDALVNVNETFATTLAMLGVPCQRESLAPRTVPGLMQHLPPFPFVTEVPCYGHDWDPTGGVWGRPGHAALLVKCGEQGIKSQEATDAKRVKDRKKSRWHGSGERLWPFWENHESEATYWLPGTRDSGRGWSGSQIISEPAL